MKKRVFLIKKYKKPKKKTKMKEIKLTNEITVQKLERDFTQPCFTLHPDWVTGFTDGEGSFIIAILPSTSNKKKVSLRFSLTQKSHSVGILYDLQKFFDCGIVIKSSKDCMRFVVQKKEDILNKIIPHFCNYPLKTSKELNFKTFKEASEIVAKNEHLNINGLNKIIKLKNEMNTNRTFDELFNHCNSKPMNLKSEWVHGFVDAEGSFGLLINKNKTGKIITRNRLSISQSSHDFAVLKAIKIFFNAGYLYPKIENIDNLEKAKSCKDSSFYYNSTPETFFNFFENYPMLTRKLLDYQDFKIFYSLKKNKAYLTNKGFEEMYNIAINVNSGRNKISKYRK